MSQLINTIIVLAIIITIWFLLRILISKLVEPHKSLIYNSSTKNSSNRLGYLSAERGASGFESVLVDDKKTSNKDVAEVFVIEDQSSVEFRNILLIDNSGSTAADMDSYKNALKSFIATPFTGEKNALYTFSEQLKQRCDFTDSQSILINAIDSIEPEGTTALNDALIAAAELIATQEMLEKKNGKSIFYNIILFTDGLDNDSRTEKEELINRLVGKTLFIVCTDEADLPLMYELAKNPRNVYIIGSGGSPQNVLGNVYSNTLEDALLKIRQEKLKGRGTAAYVQMKDGDNQSKIKGFVNVLGEIYTCGSQGEGAFFVGLTENPGGSESKVYLGNYIVASRTNEDFFVDATGPFGSNKSELPITPTVMSAGAWTIYLFNKREEEKSKPEDLINAFPKVALFSLLIWYPVYLLYWFLKYVSNVNIFGWLGKEFDITITQILLYFFVWIVISTLYVDSLRRKKKFILFNDAINNVVGVRWLMNLNILLSIVGIILSVLVFYPFSYSAFFVCTLIAFSASMILSYGGNRTWFINLNEPSYIPVFVGNESGKIVRLEFEYETSTGISESQTFEIRSKGNSNKFDSIKSAAFDVQSQEIIDYLENAVHITSIVKGHNPMTEAVMLAALGSIDFKPINPEANECDFSSPSEILLKSKVSMADKLCLIIALFSEAAYELIYSDDLKSFAYRTSNKLSDSPFIFQYQQNNYYYFSYDNNKNVYQIAEAKDASQLNWLTI
jgi:uncharacterized protein YegL